MIYYGKNDNDNWGFYIDGLHQIPETHLKISEKEYDKILVCQSLGAKISIHDNKIKLVNYKNNRYDLSDDLDNIEWLDPREYIKIMNEKLWIKEHSNLGIMLDKKFSREMCEYSDYIFSFADNIVTCDIKLKRPSKIFRD